MKKIIAGLILSGSVLFGAEANVATMGDIKESLGFLIKDFKLTNSNAENIKIELGSQIDKLKQQDLKNEADMAEMNKKINTLQQEIDKAKGAVETKEDLYVKDFVETNKILLDQQ